MKRVRLHRPDYELTARRGQMEAEVSPPSCALLHRHTFGKPFFFHRTITLRPLPAHTLSHTHTHIETCHGVNIHTPQPLQLHKIWQPALFMKDTAAPSCSFLTQKTDWHAPVHIGQSCFLFVLFKPNSWSHVRFTPSLCSVIPLSQIIFS